MGDENIDIDNEYNDDPNVKRSDFPSDFLFGVGTSSYQIEGAWNEGGKGLHIWDCFALRHPENITDGSNACVTIDFYHKMKEDVQVLKKMGVNSFRFSISWSRILPGGKVSMGKSLEGINFYNRLIDELIANDIEPFVTLFHWDLPNALEEEYLGFLSPKIVDDFVNYAEICFWEFGDRVKNWVTLNEPFRFTDFGYVSGISAPGRGGKNQEGDTETEPYIVAYNLLNCHAGAYTKYQEEFKDAQNGKVGITLDVQFYKPYHGKGQNGYQDDLKAVDYAHDFTFGLFMEPITSGDWPTNVKEFATKPSLHHSTSRLPVFTEDQKKKLIHSYDFLGINYYTSSYAQFVKSSGLSDGFVTDGHYKESGQDSTGKYIGQPAFKGSWVYLCPNELIDLLLLIKKTYKVEKYFLITENGAPEENEDGSYFDSGNDPNKKKVIKTYEQVKDDAFRLKYIKWHLDAIKRANSMLNSETPRTNPWVMGYYVWSFTDSYEWSGGYTQRFGLNYVDYQNNLLRYPKKSALWFKKFLSGEKLLQGSQTKVVEDGVNGERINATESDRKKRKINA
ncbi:hypothetical protein QVD17_27853 [Tagetes erecta]|uniref:Uncharacterized protein n=1 Tax=Tagetes erecta TaxID=13708 RepID=A0AAD8KE01_TARER|nr:hypothetical protein QVD17_27853 [Tagetes erecta]